MAYTPNAIRLHLCTGKFDCKLFLLVFISCIFVFEKFLAVRFSYESTNTLSVFIFLLTLEWISFHHVENLISCKINVSFCSKLKFLVFLFIFLFDNDGRISPFLEWLHSLAHRCSLWKHKCWIPSYSERSRRQLQSKGRELWTDRRF